MLYIVTPLSRPENLSSIRASIFNTCGDKNFRWVIVVDGSLPFDQVEAEYLNLFGADERTIFLRSPYFKALAGHAHRNYFIDVFKRKFSMGMTEENKQTAWMYFLDDDTTLHRDFFDYVHNSCNSSDYDTILFNQTVGDSEVVRLIAALDNIKVGSIDTGQFVVRIQAVIDREIRFEALNYCADGVFIESFYNATGGASRTLLIHRFLSHYNALRNGTN